MDRKAIFISCLYFLAIIPSDTLAQAPQNAGPDGPRVTVTAAEQKTTIINALSTYITHLTAQPEFTSIASVLQTALPASVVSELKTKSGPLNGVLPTGTDALQTASWFQALPSDVKSYFSSAASQENRLAQASGNAAGAPERGAVGGVAGVVGAAAVAGAALMVVI